MERRDIDPRIARAVRYIHDHLTAKIRLAHLCRESGLSTPHFVHLFKREVGVSFKGYLKMLRIRKAQQLMRDTFRSITEVSLDVGYRDLTAFERDFKKLTHTTPRDYRRAMRKPSAQQPAQETDTTSAQTPTISADAPRLRTLDRIG